MKMQTKHFFIDTALLFLMLITAATGLLVWLVLPHELEFDVLKLYPQLDGALIL